MLFIFRCSVGKLGGSSPVAAYLFHQPEENSGHFFRSDFFSLTKLAPYFWMKTSRYLGMKNSHWAKFLKTNPPKVTRKCGEGNPSQKQGP